VVRADGHTYLLCSAIEISQGREKVQITHKLSDWWCMFETAVRGTEQTAAVVVRKILAYA